MALRDSVKLVLDGIEKTVADVRKMNASPFVAVELLESCAMQLKLCLSASENEQPGDWRDRFVERPKLSAEEERERDREVARRTSRDEAVPIMTQVVGGPEDGTLAPIDSEMPVGAKVRIGAGVYQLKADNGIKALMHVPEVEEQVTSQR